MTVYPFKCLNNPYDLGISREVIRDIKKPKKPKNQGVWHRGLFHQHPRRTMEPDTKKRFDDMNEKYKILKEPWSPTPRFFYAAAKRWQTKRPLATLGHGFVHYKVFVSHHNFIVSLQHVVCFAVAGIDKHRTSEDRVQFLSRWYDNDVLFLYPV